MTASGVPRTVDIESQFGDPTKLEVRNSGPLDSLEVQATGNVGGARPSALARLTDVPPSMNFKVKGFSKNTDEGQEDEDGDSKTVVPKIRYNGHGDSTLDGLVQVEGALFEVWNHDGQTMSLAGDAWARFTNLGHDTRLRVESRTKPPSRTPSCIRAIGQNPGDDEAGGPGQQKTVVLESVPKTGAFEFGASIDTSVPRIDIECDADDPLFEYEWDIPLSVFNLLGRVLLTGHIAVPRLEIDDLTFSLTDVTDLFIRESGATKWLTPGIVGDYGSMELSMGDVLIDPDLDIRLGIEGGVSEPFEGYVGMVLARAHAQAPSSQVRFRLAEQAEHSGGCISLTARVPRAPDPTIHVEPIVLPGPIATGVNRISIPSDGGRHTLNLMPVNLDVDLATPHAIDVQSPDWGLLAVDLLTGYAAAPFEDPDKSVNWLNPGFGHCP